MTLTKNFWSFHSFNLNNFLFFLVMAASMSIQIPWKKSSIFLKRNWAWKRMKIHLANSRTPIAVKELCQSSRSMDFWISNNLDKFKAYNSGIVLNKIDRYFVIKNAIKYLTHSCILHETFRTTRACANAWSIEVFPQPICTNTGLHILLCSVTQFWSRNIFNEIRLTTSSTGAFN